MNMLPPNVAAMQPYQSARSLRKGDGWIFMDANESPYSGEVEALDMPPLNRYPDPTCDGLREAVAAHYRLPRENLMMANGSDELIDLIVRCFVRRDRIVAAMFPSYGMYRVAADCCGVGYEVFRLRDDFSFDASALGNVLERADVLFFCSPNNPTGTLVELDAIERLAADFAGLVVVDEAYGEFADAEEIPSSIELVRRGLPNVVVLRTFSKAFAAAGIRLGYGIADRGVIDVLLRMKPPYNVNVITQAFGAALWRRRAEMEQNVRRLIESRERISAECRKSGCATHKSHANFFLLHPPEGVSAEAMQTRLIEKERIVVRRFPTVPGLENLLRISVGTPEQNKLFITTLNKFIP
ncbi:MAG: histidinol-phosphate transaminase [Pirellulaceae bacterium]|nr:histidinol-phosphate transaminase [Pirellulaceae bacterium]